MPVLSDSIITDAFAGKRVMITGGLGFIGSNLARRLVTMDCRVTLVDSLIPQYGGNVHNIHGIENRVQVNIADVRDPYSIGYLIQGQHYLFNLAGQSSHLDSMTDPFTDLEINCRAQLSILEAALKRNPEVKIIFASTRQVYGRPKYLPVDEQHLLAPVDVNGINKAAGEFYHLLYNNVYHIRSCVLRMTNTYGPRMRVQDARQTFLGLWIKLLIEGSPFDVWGGEQLRDFTYVDDAIEALLIAAVSDEANGKIFNLGGLRPIALTDLAQLLVELNGDGNYRVVPFPASSKIIDIGDYYSNYKYIESMLGWTPRVSEREGLNRTLAFYRLHLDKYLGNEVGRR